MSWSPLQREILDAMGLSPYLLASVMPAAEASSAGDNPRTAQHQNGSAIAKPTNASGRMPDDALAAALLRAAGRDRAAADRDSVLRACPPPQSLRGDPRAKRALWPILRAMRRH
jgi:hypothetical protein